MARITKAQLIRLQKRLKTDVAIGKEFGITRQAIHQLRKKYDIKSNLIDNPQRNIDMYNMYKEGISITKLQKHYKLSSSQTYRIINIHKKEEEEAKIARKAKRSGNKKKTDKRTNKKEMNKATQKKATTTKGKRAIKKPIKKRTKAVIAE
jgi:hypothetical protein